MLSSHRTAEDALAAVPDEKPAIVLIDLELPGGSALKCVRQLKAVLPQTEFVIVLDHYDSEHIFNALLAGATGYLLKRTSPAEFLALLQHIHAGGSPINDELAKGILHFFHHQSSRPVQAAVELSPREKRLLQLLSGGSSYNEVADNLRISLPMVSTYVRSIYEKLHLGAAH